MLILAVIGYTRYIQDDTEPPTHGTGCVHDTRYTVDGGVGVGALIHSLCCDGRAYVRYVVAE